MTPLTHSRNLAARMGRWSAAHRKTAIFGWLAFVLVAFAIGIAAPMHVIDPQDAAVGEAGRANALIDQGLRPRRDRPGRVRPDPLRRADGRRPRVPRHDPRDDRRAVGLPAGGGPPLPPTAGNEGQISPDRHAVMVSYTPRGTYDEATAYIDTIVARVDARPGGAPGLLRRVRRHLDGQAARRAVRLAARAGRPHRHPAHAVHPAAGHRLADGRARARDARPDRPSSPRSAWFHCRASSCRWTPRSAR